MANESKLVLETAISSDFTVEDSTGIEKGSLLAMADLKVASLAASVTNMVAGIAAKEKVADDGKTTLSVFRAGEFVVYLSGTCTAGDALTWANGTGDISVFPNHVSKIIKTGAGMTSGTQILGMTMEDGTNGDTIRMELRPGYAGAGSG